MTPETSALILGDLQNDFLHRSGAYGRAGQSHPTIAALPGRLALCVPRTSSGVLKVKPDNIGDEGRRGWAVK